MRTESIVLNGTIYTTENLNQLYFNDEADNSWRNAIFRFLQNWFDDSDFVMAHTSGSTGQPKEIRLPKQSMINSAKMTNQFFELDAESTALLCLPASYIAGKMMLVRALVGGFNLITVEPTSNPFEHIEIKIDFTAITPYQLFYSAESLSHKQIKKIIVGGSPVIGQLEKLAEAIPAALYETYGMTETCSHIALRRFNGKQKSDFFEVLEGVTISQDERDCLTIKAPHLLDSMIQTNDIVELTGSQFFRWLGRSDSVINSGGVKVHPEQVEKKLEGIIPSSYFISSVPDSLLGNCVVLVLETEIYSVENEAILMEKMKQCLDKYELPRKIFYLPQFVYSQSNKILRAESLKKAMS